MRNIILILILGIIPTQAFAQRQVEYPRFKITFDGSTTVESGDTDGFWVWRTSSVTPAVSGAGTARIYFDGVNFRISENGGAYRVIGAGTVFSVALALPASVFSITGSPVTGTGTLTGSFINQTGNTLFASPSGGGAGVPTFRNLVAADYGTGTVTSTSLLDGTILFADWNQNSCALGNIPKWNGSAWACAGDDTTPGGTSWLTTGNTVGGTTSFLGTIDSNPFDIRTNNTIRGTVGATTGILDWVNSINFTSSATNTRVITGGSNTIIQGGIIEFSNRTSTLPSGSGSLSYIVMDNGILKANQANGGWVPLLGPSSFTWASWKATDGEQPATNFPSFIVRNNHPALAFDAATDETVYFTGVMPQNYDGSNIDVQIYWTSTVTTGNCIWEAKFEMMDINLDIDADSFGTALPVTQTSGGLSGQVRVATITFTQAQADAITAGQAFRLSIMRDANAAGDTLVGDAQLLAVQVKK